MDPNPYKSPQETGEHLARGVEGRQKAGVPLFIAIIARACWLVGIVWALLGMLGALMALFSESAGSLRDEPFAVCAILVCNFILPACCVSMIGLALWRRSARTAYYALALLSPTAIMLGIRFYFGTITPWE